MLEDLNGPASEEEIEQLELVLGLNLPASFRETLKIHNGESDGWPCKIFADRGAFLGTDRIQEEWQQRQTISADIAEEFEVDQIKQLIEDGIIFVEGSVKPVLFQNAWIPIMDSNGDVFWALDYSPTEGGISGQVIEVDWEGTLWRVVAPSFEAFMQSYMQSLERGEYQIVDGLPTKETSF